MQSLLAIGDLTGNEYLAGSTTALTDLHFLIDNDTQADDKWKYNQEEFPEFGPNMCTLYGFLRRLSTLIGRELTQDERRTLCEARIKIRFDKSVGGYYTDGADTVRHWHNTLFPNDPLFSVVIDNHDPLRLTLFQKGITVTSTFQGNAKYNADIKDGFINVQDYGKPTYGHCVAYHQLIKEDNYLNQYSYRNVDDYYTLLKNGVEGRTSIGLFKQSHLTPDGQIILKSMQKGLWNGSRPNDNITRWEASRVALRLTSGLKETDVWNGLNGDQDATHFEVFAMIDRATHGKIKPNLQTNMNTPITRLDTIKYIMSSL